MARVIAYASLAGTAPHPLAFAADLSTDELIGKGDKRREIPAGILASFGISVDDGNAIIMAARKHWFEEEESAEG